MTIDFGLILLEGVTLAVVIFGALALFLFMLVVVARYLHLRRLRPSCYAAIMNETLGF
jgi:hypothetical protein